MQVVTKCCQGHVAEELSAAVVAPLNDAAMNFSPVTRYLKDIYELCCPLRRSGLQPDKALRPLDQAILRI